MHYEDQLTKKEIAKRLGCSQFTLNKWWNRFGIETIDYFAQRSGLDHPKFIETVTGTYGAYYQQQAPKARDRDGHECRWCGTSQEEYRETMDRKLDVHHVVPAEDFRNDDGRIERLDAHDLDNLITLCRGCHRAIERLEIEQVRDALDV